MGKRLGKKPGVTLQTGEHELRIEFDNQENNVIWSRCFHRQGKVPSIFRAFGNYAAGYWLEKTAPTQLKLTVDIANSAWR